MMKFAGCSVTASLTPIQSVIQKSHPRLSTSVLQENLSKPSSWSSGIHKLRQGSEAEMVARRYSPPWFSVAPMMDCTDNHYRTLARIISKHAWLYTEMLAAETIVYQKDNLDRFLAFSPDQHPIVLQIGGNNLDNIAKAVELANPYGYDEINLNCGCPSPKVAGHGCFGVRLMLDPKFVGEAMSVIASKTDVPVSVKCRIGVDDHDSYNELCDFIYKVSSLSPTRHFIIHSRKALLNGISPAENRDVPPLKYEYFYALMRDFPDLRFTINGGIKTVDEANGALRLGAHGVMMGRSAYHNPWHTLGHVDTAIYGVPSSGITRRQVLEQYQVYGDSVLGKYGNKPNIRDVVKPLLHLFYTDPGNGPWKRKADAAFQYCKTIKSFFDETLVAIPDYILDARVAEPLSGREDLFANTLSLMPPPYEDREQKDPHSVGPKIGIRSTSPFSHYAHTSTFLNSTARKLRSHVIMAQMATISMTTAMLGIMARANWHPSSTHRRESTKVNGVIEKESSNERRDLMFAAAAAVCSIARVAVAEPKLGSPEAKKIYASVCVTMPTAKIYRN